MKRILFFVFGFWKEKWLTEKMSLCGTEWILFRLQYFEYARIYPLLLKDRLHSSQKCPKNKKQIIRLVQQFYFLFPFVFSNTNQSLSVCLDFWIEFKSFVWKTPYVCVCILCSLVLFDKKKVNFPFKLLSFCFWTTKKSLAKLFDTK